MDDLLALVARFIGWALVEVILRGFFYGLGWPVVKLFTLGKYPRNARDWQSRESTYVWCAGLVVFVLLVMVLLRQFG